MHQWRLRATTTLLAAGLFGLLGVAGTAGAATSMSSTIGAASSRPRTVPTPVRSQSASDPVTRPGYWEVASDGGIYSFGGATFHGSESSIRLNRQIIPSKGWGL